MEIELKYKIPTPQVADEIWKNSIFASAEETESREELCLDARYFDTKDCDLAKNEIAYRVRREGERWVASLKWKGHSEDGLHMREEINVPVVDNSANPLVFNESEIGREIVETLGEKELHCFLETRFQRRRFRIDTGTGIFEVSIDEGTIVTEYGEEPIAEVEIELFSGETDELVELGEKLQKQYDLEPENESKYARGIAIIKANR